MGDPGETATRTGIPDTVPVDYPMSLQPVVKAEPRKLPSGGHKTHSPGTWVVRALWTWAETPREGTDQQSKDRAP